MTRWLLLLLLCVGCKQDFKFCCNCHCKAAGCELTDSVSGDTQVDCKSECDGRCKLAGCAQVAGGSAQ